MLLIAQSVFAQLPKIAVFAPVYLDSAFSGENYKLGNNYLPKQILPGLDFYNGMIAAVDSLNKEKAPVEVLFYDTKSVTKSINTIISKNELQGVQLIIAVFNTRNEVKPLADYAKQLNIPLISATYPNDGGVSDNPYFYMINSTLNTHVEAMHRFLQRFYPLHNTVYVTRKGGSEDLIKQTFIELNKNTPASPLKMKMVELVDSFQT
ncbi:MAG TPA: amino acid ABC transporter substrate-binding protein, partial [Chitinophagaceae bacterium]|nr:amino acid ABC transporter substrate-binding protein [Chitinophagaceae bacterium]